MKILLAEDHHENKELMMMVLRSEGHMTHHVYDGSSLYGELSDCSEYDVLLIDVHLPKMTGVEVLKRIRNEQPDRELGRIIVFSADSSAVNDATLDELGIERFVIKPVRPSVLIKILNETPHQFQVLNRDVKDQSQVLVDKRVLIENQVYSADPDFLSQLLKKFEESVEKTLAAIAKAFEANELEKAKEVAHDLNCAAGTVGAFRLAALCRQIYNENDTSLATKREELTRELQLVTELTLKQLYQCITDTVMQG